MIAAIVAFFRRLFGGGKKQRKDNYPMW